MDVTQREMYHKILDTVLDTDRQDKLIVQFCCWSTMGSEEEDKGIARALDETLQMHTGLPGAMIVGKWSKGSKK